MTSDRYHLLSVSESEGTMCCHRSEHRFDMVERAFNLSTQWPHQRLDNETASEQNKNDKKVDTTDPPSLHATSRPHLWHSIHTGSWLP